MTSRRTFLTGLLASSVAPRIGWAAAGSPDYLAAAMNPSGKYVLCGLGRDRGIRFRIPLPDRGHAAAAHPEHPLAVAFARRPGRFALVIDCARGEATARLDAPAGRHFYGHGSFSPDGSLLFTAENDFEAPRGVIGIWDAAGGFARLGEFPSGGLGPHDVHLVDDSTLVVANGGIETHPETGRIKLNLATMQPNLAYLSLDGTLKETAALPPGYHQNSIRHLDVYQGRVAAAMQWQGEIYDAPPLLAIHERGQDMRLLEDPTGSGASMQGYAGSVAFSADGAQVCITSPRGGRAQVFDATSGAHLQDILRPDICGVAPGAAGFAYTTGTGELGNIGEGGATAQTTERLSWDNHLIPVGPPR